MTPLVENKVETAPKDDVETVPRIESGADYIESLRGRRLKVYLFGDTGLRPLRLTRVSACVPRRRLPHSCSRSRHPCRGA